MNRIHVHHLIRRMMVYEPDETRLDNSLEDSALRHK